LFEKDQTMQGVWILSFCRKIRKVTFCGIGLSHAFAVSAEWIGKRVFFAPGLKLKAFFILTFFRFYAGEQ